MKGHDKARAVLADAKAVLRRVDGQREVEYRIAGLAQELRDGLARLERADQGNDHVAYYQDAFDREVRALRLELASPKPDIYTIACAAMNACWLAQIWPVLNTDRGRRHADNFKTVNRVRRASASKSADRCRTIAQSLNKPTPGKVQIRWREQFPGADVPSPSSIRRYLNPQKK